MTTPQILSVGVLAGMMRLFIWGKFRYDLVAVLALLAALAVGVVKPKDAFTGFSDDIWSSSVRRWSCRARYSGRG